MTMNQGEFYLTDVIAMAADEGKQIRAAHPDTPVEVEGVNNRVQLAKLECAYQHEQAEMAMLKVHHLPIHIASMSADP